MPTFYITTENNNEIFRDVTFKDSALTYTFDFSPWAEENGTITTVTWTVKSGQATVSGTGLTNNVATGVITFSQAGGSLIQIKATNGTETYVAHLDVLAKDPQRGTDDYGVCS